MNVYSKLQKCRVELQKKELKMSGENKFAGYKYFELSDILPFVNELMLEHNLTSSLRFGIEGMAVLEIINCEKPEERVSFEREMATATLKGCHEVQNSGAATTYLTRYLYQAAFSIVEADVLDKTMDPNRKTESKTDKLLSDKQVKRLYALASIAGVTEEQVKSVVKKDYGLDSVSKLNKKQYDTICTRLERKGE